MSNAMRLARALQSETLARGADLLDVATVAATMADWHHEEPRKMLARELSLPVESPLVWGRVAELLTLWAEKGTD